MSGLVILGSGHAGLTLAREWRKRAPDADLTIITADDGAAYYKPNLSKALASGKTADDLVTANAEKVAADYSATLLTGSAVVAIDTDARTVELANGNIVEYAQLVMANGASCRQLPMEGDAAEAVLHVNNRLDYQRFREQLPANGRVALIGAGLIGCEYANDLCSQGYQVTLIDPLQWPLGALLPEAVGESLRAALTNAGAVFRMGRTVQNVNRDGDGFRLTLSDGEELQADLVLSAVGLVPNTDIARAAGIACNRGIQVDASMRTNVDGVFAVGDVAEVCGHLLPYILPITNCARALAATLTGEPATVVWPAMPVIVKTPVLPTLVCPPPVRAPGAWKLSGEAPDWTARFESEDGRLLGFALTGAAVKNRGPLATETVPPDLSAGL